MRSITFYKPNSKNTGGAAGLSCSVNARNNQMEVYLNMVKQVSWDSKNRKGSFKSDDPNNKIAIKFGINELGSIVNTIRTSEKFSTVHVSDSGKTSITFGPYSTANSKGFSLSVSRDGRKFGLGFTYGEAVVLEEFCRNSIGDLMLDKE